MMPKTRFGKFAFWTFVIVLGVYFNLQSKQMDRQESRRKDILAQNAALQKRREATTHPASLATIEAQQRSLDKRAKDLAIELGRIKE
jgi:hypothetical protein